jgi:hypothetical protein
MVVPLNLTMSKFGNYIPADISKVVIKSLAVNTTTYTGSSLTNLLNSFAPAAYKEMADEEKLAAPSYENQQSGIRLNVNDNIVFDYSINRLVQYETILSDFEEEAMGLQNESHDFFKPFVSGGAVGRCVLSKTAKENMVKASATAEVLQEQYAVVSSRDLTNVNIDNVVFNSKSEADEFLKALLASDPSKKGKVQLSPAFQMV